MSHKPMANWLGESALEVGETGGGNGGSTGDSGHRSSALDRFIESRVIAPVIANAGPDGVRFRQRLHGEQLAAPDLLCVEVVAVIRRQLHVGILEVNHAERAVIDLLPPLRCCVAAGSCATASPPMTRAMARWPRSRRPGARAAHSLCRGAGAPVGERLCARRRRGTRRARHCVGVVHGGAVRGGTG